MAEDFHVATDSHRESLFEIATFQRKVLLCILANIAVSIVFVVAPSEFSLPIIIIGVLVFSVIVYFAFQLAKRLYSFGTTIVLSILVVIPYLGFLILMMINSKATETLQINGIKVGLLGAKRDRIP